MRLPVLVVRPEPGNAATSAKVRNLGLEAISLPLFSPQPLMWACPDPGAFDAVLLTSANGVRYAGADLARLTGLPAFAVGPATAQAAFASGFGRVETGPGNAEALIAMIETRTQMRRLLHLCGNETTRPNSEILHITCCKTYEMIDIPQAILPEGSAIVLLHSPRAAQQFSVLVGDDVGERQRFHIVAISDAASKTAGSGWARVAIAPEPRDEAMIALLPEMA